MNFMDLLRMSGSNLRRRKLRTFLTVLGVIIGTTSIVVMISLGLGMQQALYRQVEQSGGLTAVTVRGKSAGESMMYYGEAGDDDDARYIDDELIKKLGQLEHVKSSFPQYEMSALFLKGQYEGYISLMAMPREALLEQNIPLKPGGEVPKGDGPLEFIYGNMLSQSFYERGTGKGYWETGELPDIDFEKDSMFMILDQDAYHSSNETGGGNGGNMSGNEGGTQSAPRTAQKHVVKASGVVEGGPEDYNEFCYRAYCDINVLKQVLKREFSGRVIPGQPATKSGKPYRDFFYSTAQVRVDDIDNVEPVAEEIRRMGYTVDTNAEFLKSMQKEFAMVQAVLGGIGAISLFVAAIGIANTMMMSIYERTKEIGVIKVLGCSLKNIKQMFLMEAASIGLIGGVIGNLLSFLLSFLINLATGHGAAMGFDGDISYIPWWLALLSMVFAMFVGITAGYFPAKRAMSLSPLAAIRGE